MFARIHLTKSLEGFVKKLHFILSISIFCICLCFGQNVAFAERFLSESLSASSVNVSGYDRTFYLDGSDLNDITTTVRIELQSRCFGRYARTRQAVPVQPLAGDVPEGQDYIVGSMYTAVYIISPNFGNFSTCDNCYYINATQYGSNVIQTNLNAYSRNIEKTEHITRFKYVDDFYENTSTIIYD